MSAMPLPATLKLASGESVSVELLPRPVEPANQVRVTNLLAAEGERTDVDWLMSLQGAYAGTLTSVTAIGRCGKDDVATATISCPAYEPEIAVVENVFTLAGHRRRGIAAARAIACVAEPDVSKRERFLAAGYRPAGSLPRDLTLSHRSVDVTLLEHTYG